MKDKSILEQALLQVENLEAAVKSNAKGILASTMKQELSDLLKESMEEEEKDETPEKDDTDFPEDKGQNDMSADAENDDDLDNDDETKDDDDDSLSLDSDEEPDNDTDDELGSDDMGMGGIDDIGGDEDVVDMTSANDEEVLKVFKAMKPEDGIVVKKDGESIDFNDGEDEYIIKLDEKDLENNMSPEMGSEETPEMGSEETPEIEEEDVIYEIELDDETPEGEMKEGDDNDADDKEGDVDESARTIGLGYHGGLESKNTFKAGNKRAEINEELTKLRTQNGEYKKALILFKEKLNEVAVFNANLAYTTRLYTEHSTTKQEKMNILKRFDKASTMSESKSLYETIKAELGNKKPISETVADKIVSTPTTSSKILSESKAYENPEFSRIKDLMRKMK